MCITLFNHRWICDDYNLKSHYEVPYKLDIILPCRNINFDHCHNCYPKPYRGIERKDTLCDFGELVLLSSKSQSLCKCPLLKPRIAVGAQFVESINNGNETWPAKCDPMTSHQDLEQCTAQSTVVVSPDLTQLFALEEVCNGKVALETEKFKTCHSWRIRPLLPSPQL